MFGGNTAVDTMPRKKNPKGPGALIVALLVAGVGFIGYKLFGKKAKAAEKGPPPPMTEDEAVEAALQRGGSQGEMANMAYWASHPECPVKLEPNNPAHATCVQIWLRLRDKIAARQTGQKKPTKPPPPPSPQDECDPLNPDTWKPGHICFHDGTRWINMPEAAGNGEVCSRSWVEGKMAPNVFDWVIRCPAQNGGYLGFNTYSKYPGAFPPSKGPQVGDRWVVIEIKRTNREDLQSFKKSAEALGRIVRAFPTVKFRLWITADQETRTRLVTDGMSLPNALQSERHFQVKTDTAGPATASMISNFEARTKAKIREWEGWLEQ